MKISKIVKEAIENYSEINLKLIYVDIDTDEVFKENPYEKRRFVVPSYAQYYFSYEVFGQTRNITVIRKNGNPNTLITNIRVAVMKDIGEYLKEFDWKLVRKI